MLTLTSTSTFVDATIKQILDETGKDNNNDNNNDNDNDNDGKGNNIKKVQQIIPFCGQINMDDNDDDDYDSNPTNPNNNTNSSNNNNTSPPSRDNLRLLPNELRYKILTFLNHGYFENIQSAAPYIYRDEYLRRQMADVDIYYCLSNSEVNDDANTDITSNLSRMIKNNYGLLFTNQIMESIEDLNLTQPSIRCVINAIFNNPKWRASFGLIAKYIGKRSQHLKSLIIDPQFYKTFKIWLLFIW